MSRFFVVLLFLFFIGCIGNAKERTEKKQKIALEKLALEVMEVHDRSMPHHGKLFKLKKNLLSIQESAIDSIAKNEIYNMVVEIDSADVGMMDWMHTYHEAVDFLPFDEKKAYYIEQKKLIEEVEKYMNTTIEHANGLIKKHAHTH